MLKFIIKPIFILFFVLGCSGGIQNIDSKGKTIICFGNRITYGYGSQRGGGYPLHLQRLLQKKVINAGLSGGTTKGALSRLDRDVLGKNPYLVIIELGGNDFLRKIPKEKTLNNLERIIVNIQKKGAIVALCDVSSGFIMSGYRGDFKNLAKKTRSVFIPRLLEGILDNPSLKFDNIHPNDAGYEIVAKKVYQAIKPYIR